MIISKISKDTAKHLIMSYHYLGSKGFRQSLSYGLFDDSNLLVGVCVFHGLSAPETAVGAFGLSRTDQDGLFELGRLVMHPTLNGGNNTSWFVSRAIKQLCKDTNVRAIISYADSSAGHLGSIYRACNALYCGLSDLKFDYINLETGNVKERFKLEEKGTAKNYGKRARPQKHRYVWLFDETLNLNWKVVSCNKEGLPKWLRKKIS